MVQKHRHSGNLKVLVTYLLTASGKILFNEVQLKQSSPHTQRKTSRDVGALAFCGTSQPTLAKLLELRLADAHL